MKKIQLTLVAIIFAAIFSFAHPAVLNKTLSYSLNSWNAGESLHKSGYRAEEKTDTGLNQPDTVFSATASGSNTYTATITSPITAYTSHQIFNILFTNTNLVVQPSPPPRSLPGVPTTLNVNGLGAKPITKRGSTPVQRGDIIAGQILTLQYDGANFQILGDAGNAVIWNNPFSPEQSGTINTTHVIGETVQATQEAYVGSGNGNVLRFTGTSIFFPMSGAMGNLSAIGAGPSQKFGITGYGQPLYLDPPQYVYGMSPYEVIIGDTLNSDGNELRVTGNSTFSGFVGIGTASPHGYQLAVNGSAIATSVTVMLNANWPDYVFKKDYKLPSLASLKTYIAQNHRLPGMPSAQEVAKNGLNLGETDKLLTKKVEELTLYLIEKDKQLKDQDEKNKLLSDRLATLEKRLGDLESKLK